MCTHKAAVELLFDKDYVGAICVAGPMLKGNTADLTAWYLTTQAVQGLGETDVAMKNLRGLAQTVAEHRRPILALALIKEVEDLGGDIDDLVAELASMYSSDSKRIEEAELAPPPLPSIVPVQSWDRNTDPQTLIQWAKDAMGAAWSDTLTFVDKDGRLPFIPLLSSLGSADFILFVEALWRQVFAPGEVVIEQDTPGDAIYVVAEGEVSVVRRSLVGDSQELARLGPGAFFGEMAIVSRAPRAAEVVAVDRSVLLRADKDKMEELAAHTPETGDVLVAFCHARMLENLMRVSPVLSPVSVARRPDVIALFGSDYFNSGSVIIEEGQEAPGLFLIASGQVNIVKEEDGDRVALARLGPGDVFGEISLLMRRPSTATVIADEDTAVLFLPSADFYEVTRDYPELLKGAFDIAIEREAQNSSILASSAAAADDLILV
ncbi:MAG: cyclic nucleotide-binding domain-containing protein [Proteobacteria bacterium]|nr:cyclic nucleotide-binding domain-containing protein [Pseudomonadota bacterium]